MFMNPQGKTPKILGPQFLRSVWQFVAIFAFAVFLGFSVNQFRDGRLSLFEDWSPEARLTSPSGERLDITLSEAKKMFFEKAVIMIDARPAEEYKKAHIRGARSLPWYEVDRMFMEVTKDISADTPIITYCDGETCGLSHDLANFLLDLGFSNVKILVNGFTKWQNAHLPIDKTRSN